MKALLIAIFMIGGSIAIITIYVVVSDKLKNGTGMSLSDWIGASIMTCVLLAVGFGGLSAIVIGLTRNEVSSILGGIVITTIVGFVTYALWAKNR